MASPVIGFPDTISSKEMRIIDRNSAAWGVSTLQLMEAAGRSVADEVTRRLGGVKGRRIIVFAGAGGNAGDGITAARYLAGRGARVTIYLLSRPEELRGETLQEYLGVEPMDITVELILVRDPADVPEKVEADAIIDALLGIGVRGRIRTVYAKAIEAINNSTGLKVAVDVPSGLDPDTGRPLGPVVKANVTVTFHKPKKGLLVPEARQYVGELVVADIGVPPEAEIYVGPGDVEFELKPRPWTAHKGVRGRVLVIGGSETFTGAPALAALTAYRMGVDLVFVAAPERAADIIASYSPELITIKLRGSEILEPKHVEQLKTLMEKVDTVTLGMGLGLAGETRDAVHRLVEEASRKGKKIVIDADGLKHMASAKQLLGENIVVTPHAGEFRILFGREVPGPEQPLERLKQAAEEASRHRNVTILLKGPVDVITDGRRGRLNKTGAPAMAVGGTGDILSGAVAALLAQGHEPYRAAYLAAYVVGLAGSLAYDEKKDSTTPLDIIGKIPVVLRDPYTSHQKITYRRLPLKTSQ